MISIIFKTYARGVKREKCGEGVLKEDEVANIWKIR